MMIAFVTGASSGMGRCMTKLITEKCPGIKEIWVTARREAELKALSEELPGKLRCFPGDLQDPAFRERLFQSLRDSGAAVGILVNAAGFGRLGREGTLTEEESLGMVRVNCEALTAVTEALLPYLSKNARVIQFASAAAFLPQPGFAVYAATKAYVLSYSIALRQELKKRGVSVTAVCPGPVDTAFFDLAEAHAASPAYKKLFLMRTEDVTEAALEGALRKKAVVVPGIPMKTFRLLAKVLPWQLLLVWYRGGKA